MISNSDMLSSAHARRLLPYFRSPRPIVSRWVPCCFLLLATQVLSAAALDDNDVASEDFRTCGEYPAQLAEKADTYRENYVPVEYYPPAELLSWIDLGVLALFLMAGILSVAKIRWFGTRFKICAAILALGYFGLFRGGCVCPVGAVANISLGLRYPELVGTAVAILFLLPLAASLVAGRVFCSFGCPLGAVQSLCGRWSSGRTFPRWLVKIGVFSTAALLLLTVLLACYGAIFIVCGMDPYKTLFHAGYSVVSWCVGKFSGASVERWPSFAGDALAWGYLAALLVAGLWIRRPFCRFLCPYGALLGIFSLVSKYKRAVDGGRCVECGKCVSACPVDAITQTDDGLNISSYLCVECGECSSVCPRSAIVARNASVPMKHSSSKS